MKMLFFFIVSFFSTSVIAQSADTLYIFNPSVKDLKVVGSLSYTAISNYYIIIERMPADSLRIHIKVSENGGRFSEGNYIIDRMEPRNNTVINRSTGITTITNVGTNVYYVRDGYWINRRRNVAKREYYYRGKNISIKKVKAMKSENLNVPDAFFEF